MTNKIMTREQFETFLSLSEAGFVYEFNSLACDLDEDGMAQALVVRITNPNNCSPYIPWEDREAAMKQSAKAFVFTIDENGTVTHEMLVAEGEKVYDLWDEPEAQNALLRECI